MYSVLFLDHLDRIGGSQLYLADLVQNLDATKYNAFINIPIVDSFLPQADPYAQIIPYLIPDVKQEKTIKSFLNYLGATVQIARFVQKEQVDIVHTNSVPAQAIGWMVRRLTQIQLVWSIHDQFAPVGLVRFLSKGTDRIIANSDFIKNYIVENYRVAPVQVESVPNGVDVQKLRDQALHAPLNTLFDADTKKVGIFAQIVPWKGHRLFLEAARHVLSERNDVEFVIVGQGDDSLEADLETYCKAWGIAERIHFLGFRQNPFGIMSHMDIVVSCSLKPEPFGRTVIEAGALGVPVVAFAEGGVSEIICHNETGILVPPRDVGELAKATLELVNDESKCERFGRNAQARVSSNFSVAYFIQSIEEIYSALLDSTTL